MEASLSLVWACFCPGLATSTCEEVCRVHARDRASGGRLTWTGLMVVQPCGLVLRLMRATAREAGGRWVW